MHSAPIDYSSLRQRARPTDVAAGDDLDQVLDPAVPDKLADWQGRWSGVRSWLASWRGYPSQRSLVRQRALAAIAGSLATVTALHERRTGRSHRSADIRILAIWFAEGPTDAASINCGASRLAWHPVATSRLMMRRWQRIHQPPAESTRSHLTER
jgi:hypothetical protein